LISSEARTEKEKKKKRGSAFMAKDGSMKYFIRKPAGSDHYAFFQTEDGRERDYCLDKQERKLAERLG